MSELLTELQSEIDTTIRGMKAKVKRAYKKLTQKVKRWINLHFPEDTGTLILNTFFSGKWKGKTLFKLKLGINEDADYAYYVNKMKGVKWQNIKTVEQFFTVLSKAIKEWWREELKKELGDLFNTKNIKVK